MRYFTLFSYKVLEIWSVFCIYSTTHFRLVTFQVVATLLNSTPHECQIQQISIFILMLFCTFYFYNQGKSQYF